jgi:hypothetical protein
VRWLFSRVGGDIGRGTGLIGDAAHISHFGHIEFIGPDIAKWRYHVTGRHDFAAENKSRLMTR